MIAVVVAVVATVMIAVVVAVVATVTIAAVVAVMIVGQGGLAQVPPAMACDLREPSLEVPAPPVVQGGGEVVAQCPQSPSAGWAHQAAAMWISAARTTLVVEACAGVCPLAAPAAAPRLVGEVAEEAESAVRHLRPLRLLCPLRRSRRC
jgi:hypothetical protein